LAVTFKVSRPTLRLTTSFLLSCEGFICLESPHGANELLILPEHFLIESELRERLSGRPEPLDHEPQVVSHGNAAGSRKRG
jgi:hypothetical protein